MAVKIKKGSEMMQIPVVPLVDTVFNLLIFFLVATKVAEAEKELPVALPYASEAQAITVRPAEMIINIDQKGHCFIGDLPASLHELNLALHNGWITSRGRLPVTLRAEERRGGRQNVGWCRSMAERTSSLEPFAGSRRAGIEEQLWPIVCATMVLV